MMAAKLAKRVACYLWIIVPEVWSSMASLLWTFRIQRVFSVVGCLVTLWHYWSDHLKRHSHCYTSGCHHNDGLCCLMTSGTLYCPLVQIYLLPTSGEPAIARTSFSVIVDSICRRSSLPIKKEIKNRCVIIRRLTWVACASEHKGLALFREWWQWSVNANIILTSKSGPANVGHIL